MFSCSVVSDASRLILGLMTVELLEYLRKLFCDENGFLFLMLVILLFLPTRLTGSPVRHVGCDYSSPACGINCFFSTKQIFWCDVVGHLGQHVLDKNVKVVLQAAMERFRTRLEYVQQSFFCGLRYCTLHLTRV